MPESALYAYITEEYQEYLVDYNNLNESVITIVKEYIRNITKQLISETLSDNFTMYMVPYKKVIANAGCTELNNTGCVNISNAGCTKIKIFSDKFIYILTISSKINNLYTIWYKDKINIT